MAPDSEKPRAPPEAEGVAEGIMRLFEERAARKAEAQRQEQTERTAARMVLDAMDRAVSRMLAALNAVNPNDWRGRRERGRRLDS